MGRMAMRPTSSAKWPGALAGAEGGPRLARAGGAAGPEGHMLAGPAAPRVG